MCRTGTLVAAAAIVLGLTACSSSGKADNGGSSGSSGSSSGFSQYESMTGTTRENAVIAAAKKEGTVVVYGSNTDFEGSGIKAAFEKKYGIKVTYTETTTEAGLHTLDQEASAGKSDIDVFFGDTSAETDAFNAGYLHPYKSDILGNVIRDARKDGWVVDRFSPGVVAWNTQALPNHKVPTSWQDLENPDLKGKIVADLGDWQLYAAQYQAMVASGMSTDDADKLFKAVFANVKPIDGHNPQAAELGAGQYAVALWAHSQIIDKAAKKGAPIAYKPAIQPVPLIAGGAGLVKLAPHPAAATLLIDFLLTDAQKLYADAGRMIANPTADPGFTNPLPDGTKFIQNSADDLGKDADAWTTAYTNLLHRSGPVHPADCCG